MRVPDDPPSLLQLDPVVTLQVGDAGGSNSWRDKSVLGDKGKLSSVTGLCLVGTPTRILDPSTRSRPRSTDNDDTGECSEDEDDDDDDNEPLHFQCRQVLEHEFGPSSVDLRGRNIVSCHANGDSFVWDLEGRRIQTQLCTNRGGPGLAIRCMASKLWGDENGGDEVRIIYQTRDEAGTLSLHERKPDGTICQVQSISTQSQSFCAASPCANHPDLVVTPDGDETAAIVRDFRMDPSSHPAAVICTSKLIPPPPATPSSSWAPPSVDRTYGMLTSLAFAVASSSSTTSQEATHACPGDVLPLFNLDGSRPLVACGMESGHVLLFDLAAASSRAQPVTVVPSVYEPIPSHPVWLDDPSASISLGADPVLALDMAPSDAPAHRDASLSMVIAAGLAGTMEDVAALDAAEQGRVALIKCRRGGDDLAWTGRIRNRYATCRIPSDRADSQDWIGMGGKPGVSQCHFRPGQGRLLAVAGWDRRVRIFDRAATRSSNHNGHGSGGSAVQQSSALAVLRGHATTVTAIDWASDAETSGLLASGGNDGRIHLWRLNL
jgi:WD40 repeat protein